MKVISFFEISKQWEGIFFLMKIEYKILKNKIEPDVWFNKFACLSLLMFDFKLK